MTNKILFVAQNASLGTELWVSDGSTATVLDLNSGNGSSNPLGIFALADGRALFSASNGSDGVELWVSDGTVGGTSQLANLATGGASSSPTGFTQLASGKVVFRASGGAGAELFVYDPVAHTTGQLLDINSGGSSNPQNFTLVGDGSRAVFQANDGSSGAELWVTDGTVGGTSRLMDIRGGASGSAPDTMARLADGNVLFMADDGANGRELWITGGTAGSTSLLAQYHAGSLGVQSNLNTVVTGADQNLVLFSVYGAYYSRVWAVNATTHAAVKLTGLLSSYGSSIIGTGLGDGHAVVVATGSSGYGLWVTDGTTGGTSRAVNLAGIDKVQNIAALDATHVIFSGRSGGIGYEARIADLATGQTRLFDLSNSFNGSFPHAFRALGNGQVMFSASGDSGVVFIADMNGSSDIFDATVTAVPGSGLALGNADLFTLLSNPPAVPAVPDGLDLISDSGANTTDDLTCDDRPDLFGTAAAGSLITVTITDSGNASYIVSTIAAGDGSWTVAATNGGLPMADDVYGVVAVATDAAGNTSGGSSSYRLEIYLGDLTLATTADGQTLYGMCGADTLSSIHLNAVMLAGGGSDAIQLTGSQATISGEGGDDVITISATGGNTIDGGAGTDRVSYDFFAEEATVRRLADGSLEITRNGQTDTLTGVEELQFKDGNHLYRPAAPVQGDTDGDFHAEMMLLNSSTGDIQLAELDGVSLGTLPINGPFPGNLLDSADFNGDGKSDLLFRDAGNRLTAWMMNGTSKNSTEDYGSIGAAVQLRGIGDTNGDGFNDLVLRDSSSGMVSVWTIDNTGVTGQYDLGTVSLDWEVHSVGDFNGDGAGDILFQHQTTEYLWLWELAGPGQPQVRSGGSHGLGGPSSNWQLQGTGDFDGDGITDLLWGDSSNGELYIWGMQGNAIKRTDNHPGDGLQGSIGLAPNREVAGVLDLTADGRADIVLRASDGTLSIWQMNGLTVLQEFNNISNPGSDWHLV